MFFASHIRSTKAAVTVVALGLGAMIAVTPAEARMGMGGFHGGGFHGPMGGFRGPGMMHAGFGGFRQPGAFMHPGFRPGFGQHRFFAHRAFFHRHNRFGGPFAVGLLSGAALGAFAYGSPYYGYGGYYSDAGYGDDCYVIRRRVVNPWGYVTVRRALVCG